MSLQQIQIWKPTVFLGLEMTPETSSAQELFLAHELTHGMHTLFTEFGHHKTLAESLFIEGLAVATSELVVPGLKPEAYLWVGQRAPENWYQNCLQQKKEIIENLEGTLLVCHGYMSDFFGQGTEAIPCKFGYFLGYELIKTFLKRHSIEDLIHWGSARIQDEICEEIRLYNKS